MIAEPTKVIAQLYDKEQVHVYTREHQGFLFSHTEVVRTETIKNWSELHIKADTMPDVVFYNGEEYTLTKGDLLEPKK